MKSVTIALFQNTFIYLLVIMDLISDFKRISIWQLGFSYDWNYDVHEHLALQNSLENTMHFRTCFIISMAIRIHSVALPKAITLCYRLDTIKDIYIIMSVDTIN